MSTSSNVIKSLGKDNYDTWAMQIEAVMVKNGTWKYVNGRITKPELVAGNQESKKAVEAWEDGDAKAKSDLIIAIDPSLLRLVKGLITSQQVWERLRSEFASTGPVKKAGLMKRISTYKIHEGDDIRVQLMDFFDIATQLESLGIAIHPELLTILLLNGLPSSFDVFRCAIEARDELPKPEWVREKILEEYDSRNQKLKDGESEAMWIKKSQKRFKSNQGEKSSGNKAFRYKCFRCHRVGHKASNCPEKGSREGAKHELSSKAVVESVTDAFQASEETTAEVFRTMQSFGQGRWCLDSGCTSHMCNNEDLFMNTPMRVENGRLLLASDACTNVDAKGTAQIATIIGKQSRSVKLNNTLLVKNLRTNLLSVARIADYGNTITFDKDGATVRGEDGKVKLQADRVGNLYYVREDTEQVNSASVSGNPASLETWHRRLGHLNVDDLLKLSRKDLAVGIKIEGKLEIEPCDTCLRGKMTTLSFPKKSERKTKLLELIHSDVWGPSRTESFKRARYFVTFIDDSSRWCEVYFLRNKNEVLRAFKEYKVKVETQTGQKVKCLMSDNGGEYVNREFDEYLKANGIRRRLTVANTPQQNGIAERKNRTLVEMTRCLLIQSGLSKNFWAEALATSNYLRNRCPTASLEGRTPYEAWNRSIPNLSNLREFGAKTYVLEKGPGREKFEPRSKQGTMVGYSDEAKGYRVWIPEDKKVVVTRDVQFVEDHKRIRVNEEPKNESTSTNKSEAEKLVEIPASKSGEISQEEDSTSVQNEIPEIVVESPAVKNLRLDSVRVRGRPRLICSGSRGRPRKIYQTRSTSKIGGGGKEKSSDNDEEMDLEINGEDVFVDALEEQIAIIESANLVDVTLREAMNGENAEDWLKAIAEEVRGLIKNNTWKLVNRPKNRTVITSKIVLRNKMKPDGTLERRKARIVARGFTQRKGIDFTETFAPVARLDSVRLLMALAVRENLKVYQLDVVAAYLNGKLDEEIFMEPPNYIEEALTKIIEEDGETSELGIKAREMQQELNKGDKVCQLIKALYGLRQAGRQWNKRLDETLRNLNLVPATNESCLYYDLDANEFTILVIYVDDILYASRSQKRLEEIKAGIEKAFKVRDLGPAHCCLGIEIEQKNNEIKLSQRKYVKDLLKRFGMEESKSIGTPSDPRVKLPSGVRRIEENRKEKPYRELIGSLMYLAVATRPDIAFIVNRLAQFNESYMEEHWSAAKRILRYLNGTKDYGLVYSKSPFGLVGYSDADHANDIADRISYTGYVFNLSGAAITWRSRKQRSVAISTTEAEYVALSEASREAIYLKNLMQEMRLKELSEIIIRTDNRGAKCIAENAVFHSRTKHIATRYHFVRQAVKEEKLKLEYVPTERMPADILTKPLPGPAHYRCMNEIGIKIV